MKRMKIKHIVCTMLLFVMLIPCSVFAQNDEQAYSERTFSNEELAQMLAPIALYPDSLLSQILMAATYPFEVAEAERWVVRNPYVKGEELDEALQAKDWDVSVLSLCHYPKILTMMSENLSWTARLGDAFTNQEEDVMDTVQELRARARAAGNLVTTSEQKVIIEDRYIRIEPYAVDYIYVPAYDPYVVYGHWWLPLFPPFPIILPGLVVTGPGIFFSPGFHVGFGVFGWSHFNWRERRTVIVDIDRTRRYNRHIHTQRTPNYQHWRPDRDRRVVRERRGGEIPRFSPPVKPRPDVRHWDRKPGPDVRTPDKLRPAPNKPRAIDRNKRPDPPRIGERDRKSDADPARAVERDKRPQWNQPQSEKGKAPDENVPSVVDPGRSQTQDRRVNDREKRVDPPRIDQKDKALPPQPGPVENKQPVIRDRGRMESSEPRKVPPLIDQKGVMSPDNARERGEKGSLRPESRDNRNEMPQRSEERWGDRPDRQDRPDRGGAQRERGERK